MWLAEVSAKAKRHNQILFSKESLLLDNLRHLIDQSNRRALTLWALELAEETVLLLTERYPEDLRPGEAIAGLTGLSDGAGCPAANCLWRKESDYAALPLRLLLQATWFMPPMHAGYHSFS